MRRRVWIPATILLLALLLRLVNLGGRPFWYDEAFSQLYAAMSPAQIIAGTVTTADGAAAEEHPIFYYLLLHAWMVFAGASPFAMRLLSALLGTVTVGLGMQLGELLFDRRTGLIWGLLIALSPFALYYSQELRMYALLGCAALAALYYFVRAWREGAWWQWVLFAVAGAAAMYAHNLGALFLAGIGFWVLWVWGRERRLSNLRPLLGSAALLLLLFAPWLLVLPAQLRKVQEAYWVARPDLLSLLQTTLVFHFSADNQGLPGWLLPPAFTLSILVPALLLLESRRAAGGAAAAYIPPFPNPRLFLLFTGGGQVLLTFLISQVTPVYIIRALLPAALVYYGLVAAILFARQTPPPVRWGVGLVMGVTAVLALGFHFQYDSFPRAPFREVADDLAAESASDPEMVILHSNKLSYLPLHRAAPALPARFLADPPGSAADTLSPVTQEVLGIAAAEGVETAVGEATHLYFVIFTQELAEFGTGAHPTLAWLEERYAEVGQREYADLVVIEFVR